MYAKSIIYDAETRDFAMYLDGQLVGYARTYREAEETLDALVYELLSRATADEDAALAEQLVGEPAISEPVCIPSYQGGAMYEVRVTIGGSVVRYHLHERGVSYMGVVAGEEPAGPDAALLARLTALCAALFAPTPTLAEADAVQPEIPTPSQVAAACKASAEEYRDGAAAHRAAGNLVAARQLEAAARAADKAAFFALEGTAAARWAGDDLLVRSATDGSVYRVTGAGCPCKAGANQRSCWHAELRHGHERATDAIDLEPAGHLALAA